MPNNKEEKIYKLYKKATINISTILIKNILKNSETSDFDTKELIDVSELMIIGMTKKFNSYNPGDRLLTPSNFEEIKNVCRESLLKLSGKSDLVPDEKTVAYCSQQVMELLLATKATEELDDED
jgi:hypothetical protein